MTDAKSSNPSVVALRGIYSALTPEQQEIIKQAAETIEQMEAAINEQQQVLASKQPLPEARASANVSVVDPTTKADVQRTFRGWTDAEVTVRVNSFIAEVTGQQPAQKWLTQNAYRDEFWGNKGQGQPAPAGQPSAPPPQPTGTNGTQTCPAQKLVAAQKSANDSSLMWKVWTPKSKYAVAIYLEDDEMKTVRERLAQAGIDVSVFVQPNGQLSEHDLSGWTAHYVTDEGKSWPKKIVDLTK